MGRVWKKKCPVCGADFEAKLKNIKYCTACRALSTSVRERRAGKDVFATNYAVECGEMPAAKSETASRACHDCGRRTTDYRCPACRAAFLARHGVAVEAKCDERFIYA
ncbi:hypothetical protein [uncultured Desulfovibrio sp.]|uniref:hypothetical protein n=1 Tax=uncultured Desulfovibrio sp. TaxID=167968 RepID=UPI00262B248A|nr:hypothetical protein [uncultured Desulfovibrio sp.]